MTRDKPFRLFQYQYNSLILELPESTLSKNRTSFSVLCNTAMISLLKFNMLVIVIILVFMTKRDDHSTLSLSSTDYDKF